MPKGKSQPVLHYVVVRDGLVCISLRGRHSSARLPRKSRLFNGFPKEALTGRVTRACTLLGSMVVDNCEIVQVQPPTAQRSF